MAQVEITAMTFGPFGVGRLDGKAVMVPNVAPGDLLEVTITQERAGYFIARAERVLKAGAARRIPPCPYLPRCGGCDWQQIDYPEQARFKAEVIAATLNRALGLALDPATLIEPAPAEFGYRSRIRFKARRGGRLGFYEAGSRRLVEVERCMVAAAEIRMPLEFAAEIECEEIEVVAAGTFIAIGHEPQSELVRGQVEVDDAGYVITEGKSTRTNRPGVFAAGDLVDHTYRQAITAAASGCEAALDAEWYLRDTPEVPTPAGLPEGDLAEAQWAAPAVATVPAPAES